MARAPQDCGTSARRPDDQIFGMLGGGPNGKCLITLVAVPPGEGKEPINPFDADR